jgi:hypothetical protein
MERSSQMLVLRLAASVKEALCFRKTSCKSDGAMRLAGDPQPARAAEERWTFLLPFGERSETRSDGSERFPPLLILNEAFDREEPAKLIEATI